MLYPGHEPTERDLEDAAARVKEQADAVRALKLQVGATTSQVKRALQLGRRHTSPAVLWHLKRQAIAVSLSSKLEQLPPRGAVPCSCACSLSALLCCGAWEEGKAQVDAVRVSKLQVVATASRARALQLCRHVHMRIYHVYTALLCYG